MNIFIEKQVGGRIRYLREKAGFTQEYVATRLQLEGCDITRSALAKIEVGQRHVYVDEIFHLQKILKADFKDFFLIDA